MDGWMDGWIAGRSVFQQFIIMIMIVIDISSQTNCETRRNNRHLSNDCCSYHSECGWHKRIVFLWIRGLLWTAHWSSIFQYLIVVSTS